VPTAATPSRGALALTASELAGLGLGFMPPGLVGDEWARRLRELPCPGPCLTYGAFECRLDDDPRVDFLACAPKDDAGDRLTAPHVKASAQPALSAFEVLAAWAQPGPLNTAASTVWLEYDVPREGSGANAQPFAFVRLEPVPWGVRPTVTPLEVALDVLVRIHRLPAPAMEALRRCEAALPLLGQMCHVAVLPHRQVREVRVHLGLPHHDLSRYLAAIAWPGDMAQVRDWLPPWQVGLDVAGFQLDVGELVAPNLGMEFYLPTSPGKDGRWAPLFERLASSGLGTRDKLEAIARWPGTDLDPARGCRVERTLLVKVALDRQGTPAAKAYLAFTPRAGR